MDFKSKLSVFVNLIFYICHVSGVKIPQPEKLEVNILDGEVIVLWKQPADAPSNSTYNVQMAKYIDEWAMVAGCTRITQTYCELSGLIHDYVPAYKVKVQLVNGDDESAWTSKKFLLNQGKLQPPSFSLQATSSTLTVTVHQKPILSKLFPFGLTYTIYLEERGDTQKNTMAYLDDQEAERVFTSLHWGIEYCVSIKAEGKGTLSASGVSSKQCLLLPEKEWYVMAVSSLSILAVLGLIAILVAFLLCYLKHPVKTPAALKSPVSGWLPLSVGDGAIEVVTDKGWFLSSYRMPVTDCVKDPVTRVTVMKDSEEENRRTSMDSGVSMRSNSASNNGRSPPTRQEDSGCGSMGGSEGSTSCQTDYPIQDERTETDTVRKREDSGVGMGCHLDTSSLNLDSQDSGPLKELVAGGNYRSQSPPAVQSHACGDEDTFKEIHPDTVLAEVVTGYRAGPQLCICSGAGQCPWCHKQGHYGTEVIKQYRSVCIENGLLGSECDMVDSYKGGVTAPGCTGKTQTDTVTMDDLESTFIELGDTFPLLTSLPPLHLMKCGQDFNMNNVSLSLYDVQLKTE